MTTILDPDAIAVAAARDALAGEEAKARAGDTPPKRRGPGRPRKQDRTPRSAKAASKARKDKPSEQQILEALTEALGAPAVPMFMTGHQWPGQHITRSAPDLAESLVNAGKVNPWLQAKLEALATGENMLGAFMVIAALTSTTAAYLVPVIAYFSEQVPDELAERFGAPPIYRPEPQVYSPGEPESPDAAAPAAPGPPSAVSHPSG